MHLITRLGSLKPVLGGRTIMDRHAAFRRPGGLLGRYRVKPARMR
jgi:hypothetical protein